MKKTFISPVAQFVATEAQQVIATSTFSGDKIDNTGTHTGGNDARSNNGGNGTTNASNPINVEALDF